jgi:hypothetical protein
MKCSRPASAFTADVACPHEATVICWADCPGWRVAHARCELHRDLFTRMIAAYYRGTTAHVVAIEDFGGTTLPDGILNATEGLML